MDAALRILDANANRAREALRVLEDYARFALNHDPWSARLKEIRHALAEAIGPLLPDAILHRDTPGDVGTDNKTASESHRPDLEAVVVAAGKRLGEALRVLEEVAKVLSPAAALAVERLRYEFYDLEQAIARTLRPAGRMADVRLYVLVTESLCRRPWIETAELAIAGGADCIQLREKSLESGELLLRAKQLVALCRKHNALCIINDRPDIALLSDADGVHLGQQDLPAVEARKLLGHRKIIGVSTHQIEQARQARLDGADYIGVGPIFPSSTKPRETLAGLDYARQAAAQVPLPAIAISGISAENVGQVLQAGVRGVAVSSAIISSDDPQAAAQSIKNGIFQFTTESRRHGGFQ